MEGGGGGGGGTPLGENSSQAREACFFFPLLNVLINNIPLFKFFVSFSGQSGYN